MISRLRGTIWEKDAGRLVVDAGGVGYELTVSLATAAHVGEVGEPVELYVSTQLREDSLQLYGFARLEERVLFLLLISVSGIGPQKAVGALSALTPGDLLTAVAEDDPVRLTRVPGIGKKTAERLIVELRDKLEALRPHAGAAAPGTGARGPALEALVSLGYARPAAERALQDAPKTLVAVQDLIKHALQRLSTAR
jgi:Holliday junction DNA helicase RuvA